MKLIDVDKIAHIIKQVVSITPGVVAFAYSRENKENEDAIALEKDITPAIDVKKIEQNHYGVKIHIISSIHTNIFEVLQEVQHRVKYELEKQMEFDSNFKIDICIDDLISE
ncbi:MULTISPECIES: Asp23/Gls24 family envelope stress response protein [unclassified Spiroplasma]|uniref:Asp23/Gls24 family envelope stress response protein n=1 Tax=unclassified Spiroplasma TaxID=2637901 RepID=UPI00313E3BF0